MASATTGAGLSTLLSSVVLVPLDRSFAGALLLMNLRRLLHETLHLALWTAFVAAMIMLLYAVSAAPWIRLKEDIRFFAERIDAWLLDGRTLHAYELDDYPLLLATLWM